MPIHITLLEPDNIITPSHVEKEIATFGVVARRVVRNVAVVTGPGQWLPSTGFSAHPPDRFSVIIVLCLKQDLAPTTCRRLLQSFARVGISSIQSGK